MAKRNSKPKQKRPTKRSDEPEHLSSAPSKNEKEERDLEFKLFRLHEEEFDPKRWIKAMAQKRKMSRTDLEAVDPGPAVFKGQDGPGVFLGAKGFKAVLSVAKNPKPKGSFGFAGIFAKLESDQISLNGTLALRFDPRKLGTVSPGSLRLFYWVEKRGQFSLVWGSQVNTNGNYVYGSVGRPGIYTVIGVNAHPLILSASRLLCALNPFRIALPEAAKKIIDPICKTILCPPDMQALEDPRVREPLLIEGASQGFPLPPGGFGPPPGNPCEDCFTLGGVLPECEILDPPHGGSGGGCREFWASSGPWNISGCIKHITIDPADPNRLYCAAFNGGVWMLNNVNNYPATSWRPLTDQLDNLRMNGVEAAQSNNQILYASSYWICMYRSNDRGVNWLALESTRSWYVYKILIHPADANTVFAATTIGFWISTNGGEQWTLSHTGDIKDAALDPLNSSIIYVCVVGDGVLKSVTAGFGPWTTMLPWSSATNPTTVDMKIALGYRNTNGSLQMDVNRTVVAKLSLEIFVSRNGGQSTGGGWVSKGNQGITSQLGWDNILAVDPFNPDVFLSGEQQLYRSTNSGDDWTTIPMPHEDQQSVQFDRNTQGLVYMANDGGVFRSTDGGQNWMVTPVSVADEIAARRSLVKNLATAEFYRVGVQNHVAVGNLFHSGLIAAASVGSGLWGEIEGHAWEWAYVFADPKRIGRFYVFHGQLATRRYPGTGTDDFVNIATFQPYVVDASTSRPVGAIAVDARPGSGIILVSAFPDSITNSGYRLMMTTEGDREPVSVPGGSVMNQPTWTTVIDNGNDAISAVIFAPSAPARAYAMSNNGRLFRKDNINAAGAWLQPGQWSQSDVRQLAVNWSNPDRLYALTGNQIGRSINAGANWVSVGRSSLPTTELNSIIAHPTMSNRLYVGADIGVFVSDDEGDTWQPYDDDLPNAEVQQIFLTGGYLYAITHGRGLWRRRLC